MTTAQLKRALRETRECPECGSQDMETNDPETLDDLTFCCVDCGHQWDYMDRYES
jgi:hypothetical protein